MTQTGGAFYVRVCTVLQQCRDDLAVALLDSHGEQADIPAACAEATAGGPSQPQQQSSPLSAGANPALPGGKRWQFVFGSAR